MAEDALFLEAAEQHEPPASETFFEELWRAAEQRQRASARRWRRTAFVLAAVAAAAVAAAGVMASSQTEASTIERSMTCHVSDQMAGRHLQLTTSVTTPRNAAYLNFTTRPGINAEATTQYALSFRHAREPIVWGTSTNLCQSGGPAGALAPSGLPAQDVVTTHFIGGFELSCTAPATVVVRARITISGGKPVAAKLAVRSASTAKPILFVVWSPTRVASWFSSRCTSYPG